MISRARLERMVFLAILCSAMALSFFTVTIQGQEMEFWRLQEGGLQANNHQEVMEGRRGSPFQYRILFEWVVEGFIRLFRSGEMPGAITVAFLLVRLLQNILLFIFAAHYYRRLGLTPFSAILGISILAWSMTQALYAADLQFNTYGDVMFYMMAGFVIAGGNILWIIPITILAAFNRETSGLIPVLLVVAYWQPPMTVPRRVLMIAGVALAFYAAIFVGLRIAFGPQEQIIPYGNHVGIELLAYNLTLPATYVWVFGVLGLLPILALVASRRWPDLLRRFFWALVPVWVLIHLFASVLAESRLLLVPVALVFIPGALFGVTTELSKRVQPLSG